MYADMYSTGGEGLEGAKGEVLYVPCLSSEYDKESLSESLGSTSLYFGTCPRLYRLGIPNQQFKILEYLKYLKSVTF